MLQSLTWRDICSCLYLSVCSQDIPPPERCFCLRGLHCIVLHCAGDQARDWSADRASIKQILQVHHVNITNGIKQTLRLNLFLQPLVSFHISGLSLIRRSDMIRSSPFIVSVLHLGGLVNIQWRQESLCWCRAEFIEMKYFPPSRPRIEMFNEYYWGLHSTCCRLETERCKQIPFNRNLNLSLPLNPG